MGVRNLSAAHTGGSQVTRPPGAMPWLSRKIQMGWVRTRLAVENGVLRLVERVLFPNRRSVSQPRSVLIYRTGRLGDFVNAVPAISAVRKRWPEARIGLLTTVSTDSQTATVASSYAGGETLPWLKFIHPGLIDEYHVFSMSAGVGSMKAAARKFIEAMEPDIAFLLPFSTERTVGRLKKLALFRAIGIRCRVYGIRVRSSLGTFDRAQFESGIYDHQALSPLKALQECSELAAAADEVDFPLDVEPAADRWAEELWLREGLDEEIVVGIFPGAAFPHKRWPVEKYAELCRRIQSISHCKFLLLGLASDQELTAKLANVLGEDAIDLAGRTTLGELAAVLARVNLFVGNDSGPAHLASALGRPCVTLMSAIEYPGFWEPWGSRHDAIRHDVPCSPCWSHRECPLGTEECIRGIQVDAVFRKVQNLLRLPGELKESNRLHTYLAGRT